MFCGDFGVEFRCVILFDAVKPAELFVRKDDIEKQIGASLEWTRFEGKASYVSYVLDYGIDDETSWPKLAKFQAEWSKKFYDVFVPLLREWDKK